MLHIEVALRGKEGNKGGGGRNTTHPHIRVSGEEEEVLEHQATDLKHPHEPPAALIMTQIKDSFNMSGD